MVIEEVKTRVPKRKKSIESFFNSCKNREAFVSVDSLQFLLHLEKAKHDLSRTISEFKDGCYDWTIIKAYYAIHHAGNALLVKNHGMFSKNHVCLIVALKHLDLISKDFYSSLRNIHSKFSDFTAFDVTYSLRKLSQYDVVRWKKINKDDAEAVISFAKKFVSFVESEST